MEVVITVRRGVGALEKTVTLGGVEIPAKFFPNPDDLYTWFNRAVSVIMWGDPEADFIGADLSTSYTGYLEDTDLSWNMGQAIWGAFTALEKDPTAPLLAERNMIALGRRLIDPKEMAEYHANAINGDSWCTTPVVTIWGGTIGAIVVHDGELWTVVGNGLGRRNDDGEVTHGMPELAPLMDGDIIAYGGSFHESGVAVLRPYKV